MKETTKKVLPIRIQRKRTKGWKMPPNTISVTRPGKFGNPFTLGQEILWKDLSIVHVDGGTKLDTIENVLLAYRFWLDNTSKGSDIKYMAKDELKGKNLACFCKEGEPCHADVLLKIVNE